MGRWSQPRPAGIRAEGWDELVRFDRYVGRREAQAAPDLLPGLDRARHRVLATQQLVRLVHVARGDEPPHLGAVQVVSIDREWRHDLDLVAVLAKPLRAAGPAAAERKVVADHPTAQVHHRGQPLDELLRRERSELAVEPQHDRVPYAGGLDQG